MISGLRKNVFNAAKTKKRVIAAVTLLARYAVIICLSFMILYPLLRMLSSIFAHPYVIGAVESVWIPADVSLDNFKVAWAIMNFVPTLLYTTMVVGGLMILQTLSAAFAGYSFARFSFRGSNILFGLVLLTIIVPTQTLMLPQYVLFRNFDVFGIITAIRGEPYNLLNKPSSMFILAAVGQGLSGGLFIYIFRQFFRGLPKELEEAAYVDGAGFLRTFFTIVFPVAKPGFLTVGVLSFIWNWNDSYFPSLFNATDKLFRIKIATLNQPSGGTTSIQLAIGNAVSRIPAGTIRLESRSYDSVILSVCTLLSILPLIALFLLIQKQFVESVERSGIVG